MRLSRIAALLLTLLAAAFLAVGCGSDDDSGDGDGGRDSGSETSDIDTPAPLEAGGDFVVCTDVPYPPAEYLEGEKFVGYEIDIMDEVAERLGTTAVYEKTLFDSIIPSLQGKRCDAIMSSMNVTPERAEEVAFVEYMETGQSLMVSTKDAPEVDTLDDLAGLSVAVQVGTTLKDALDAKSKELEAAGEDPIDVQTFPDGAAAAQALKGDRVDVFFADSPVVADYVNKDGESFAFAGEPIDPLPMGIALRLEDEELQDAVQAAIDAMYEDGAMMDILEEWQIADFALDGGSGDEESDADSES